jgi:hypothetical protein
MAPQFGGAGSAADAVAVVSATHEMSLSNLTEVPQNYRNVVAAQTAWQRTARKWGSRSKHPD